MAVALLARLTECPDLQRYPYHTDERSLEVGMGRIVITSQHSRDTPVESRLEILLIVVASHVTYPEISK
jgi:hypothetical protein